MRRSYSAGAEFFFVLFFSSSAGAGVVATFLLFGRRLPNVPRQIFPRLER